MTRRQEKFKLLSGVECTVQELTGEHEANLTSDKKGIRSSAMDIMLQDCIVTLGDKDIITLNDAKRLLDADKKHALIVIRNLSNDYDPDFKFSYEFPIENGKRDKFDYQVNFSYAVLDLNNKVIPLISDKDPSKEETLPVNFEPVNFKGRPYKKQYKTYSEIASDLTRDIKLPRSGRTVRFTMLTGEFADLYSKTLKQDSDFNSHDYILMRQPVFVEATAKGAESFVMVDLNTMVHLDITALRKSILEEEGFFDTIMTIAHKNDSTRTTRVDLISIPAFFFPSLAI